MEKYQGLYDYVSLHTGEKMITIKNMSDIYDTLYIEVAELCSEQQIDIFEGALSPHRRINQRTSVKTDSSPSQLV